MSAPVEAAASALLRQPPFALFWSSRILSNLAYQMVAVAVGWQLYDLTADPLDLGLVGLVQFVPALLLVLLVGQVADRVDRRAILGVCRTVQGAAAVLLALGSVGGWLGKDAILAAVALVAVARAFEEPTMAALLPEVVARAQISRAAALSTTANKIAQIGGPALGGVLYLLGPAVVYGLTAACFALGAGLILRARVARVASVPEPFSLQSVFSGIVFIRQKPVILGALTLDMFVVLLGGATALLPIFARDILDAGPWGLGLLRAAPAVGALAVSVALARWALDRQVGALMFGSVIVFGLATVVFGLSTNLLLSLAALAVLGMADVVSVVIRVSLVQLQTPHQMLGRVSAVNSMFTTTSNRLGDFESGLAAALFGTVPAVLIGGIGTVLVALVWMYQFPDLRRVRTLYG